MELKSKDIYNEESLYLLQRKLPRAGGRNRRKNAKQIERCRNVDDLHNFNAVDEMMWEMKGGGVLWTDV